MSDVRLLVVAFLLGGTFPAAASDGAVSIPDYGTRLTVPADGSGSIEFAHPAYDGARATVRIENGRVLAGTDNDALTLATYEPASQWNDEMAVLLMDVDFDGYLDVGVLDGVGYGGVNFSGRSTAPTVIACSCRWGPSPTLSATTLWARSESPHAPDRSGQRMCTGQRAKGSISFSVALIGVSLTW